MSHIPVVLTQICFICSHPLPSHHLAEFAIQLEKNEQVKTEFFASGAEFEILKNYKVKLHSFTPPDTLTEEQAEALAEDLVKKCSAAKYVVTDVGHPFSARIQRLFAQKAPHVIRVAYYENPEAYVPGGYSNCAQKVAQYAQKFLFANAHLATHPIYAAAGQQKEISLKSKQCIGLGFSTLPRQVAQMKDRRKNERLDKRKACLTQNGVKEKEPKILVYFGGANTEYFEKAFPHFLKLVTEAAKAGELPNTTIVLQQHPRAKKEGNVDANAFKRCAEALGELAPTMIVSDLSFDDAVCIADVALYYQTTGNALFRLSGVPTIQVAHERYPDILVRTGICDSVSSRQEFIRALEKASKSPLSNEADRIYDELGIKVDWAQVLIQSF